MKVIDTKGNIITDYDLSNGHLITHHIIKEDAAPIDNITKFAWDIEDYEEVQMYIPNKKKSAKERINELKLQLEATDYKIIKCSEYQLLNLELPYDIFTLHAERQLLRDEINRLESEV